MTTEDPFDALLFAANTELLAILRIDDDIEERLEEILGNALGNAEAVVEFVPFHRPEPIVEPSIETIDQEISDLVASFRLRLTDRFYGPGNTEDITTCFRGLELVRSGLKGRNMSRRKADILLKAIISILASVNEVTYGQVEKELRRIRDLHFMVIHLFDDSDDREPRQNFPISSRPRFPERPR